MKKIVLCLFAFASLQASAQVEPVDYRGAFAPAPAVAWTNGWTNFTPRTADYPQTTTPVLAGSITSNTVWSKANVYELKGYVYVEAGATLTIEAGTVIRSFGKAALVIKRGAKIMAEGTASEPIIFTSNQPTLSRAAGDWAGVVIIGAAQHNLATGVNAPVEGDIAATHGGSDDADNSGVFKYVRIEFGGQALSSSANSEINGLSLYSVGNGTVIDYVQVSFSGDDSYEWFGGTVNCKHLVAFRGLDDDFDTDNGFRGTVQFGVAHRDPGVADQSGSNGFESDNDANGSLRTPRTQPTFHNMTIIGPKYVGAAAPNSNFKRAAHIRRNSACSIHNSILIGFTDAGLLIDNKYTVANAVNGLLMFKGNFVSNNTTNFKLAPPSTNTTTGVVTTSDTLGINTSADVETLINTAANGNVVGTTSEDAMLTAPFNLSAPDYRPLAGSQLLGLEDVSALEAKQVIMFPNPAINTVEILLNDSYANGLVNILNATGAVVASQTAHGNTAKLDVSGLANGLYVVNITNNDKVISKTLVINK